MTFTTEQLELRRTYRYEARAYSEQMPQELLGVQPMNDVDWRVVEYRYDRD